MSSQIDLDSNQTYTNTSSVSTSKTTLTIELDDIDHITIRNNGALYSSGKRGIDTSGVAASGTSVNIENTGTISGSDDGIRIDDTLADGTLALDNSGTIESTNDGQAVDFNSVTSASSITITNESTGIIQSTDADALRPGANATVYNAGIITAGGANGATKNDGIDFQDYSGTVDNSGTISGARHGITSSADVTVLNEADATITGRDGSGVGSDGNGTVTNYGTITGAYDDSGTGDGDGVDIDGYATITNYGTIQGTGAGGNGSDGYANTSEGVSIGGGSIINESGALISGAANGILVDNSSQGDAPYATTITNYGTIQGQNGYGIHITDTFGDTITNAGTISGTTDALLLGDGNDTLNILTGSVISGTVDGGAGSDTVNLSGSGTFEGAVNFETMTVSGSWILSGDQSYSTVLLDDDATLTVQGSAPSTETITFSEGAALILGSTSSFSATLSNFAVGNSVDFSTVTYDADATVSISGNQAVITSNGITYTLTVSLADTTEQLDLKTDSDGSLLLEAVVCFLPGSLIATVDGERPVETLREGVAILTFDNGKIIPKNIVWVGCQRVTVRDDCPPDIGGVPVRITRDALAVGVPHSDLLVTPEHCLYLEGRFVPVRMLVNGSTITYAHEIRSYECYHVETQDHAVICTNGLLTESYLDTGNRHHFQPLAQQDVVSPFNRPLRNWNEHAASPLCTDRAFVEPLYRQVARRALGMREEAFNVQPETMQDPALGILLPDGAKIVPLRVVGNRYVFSLPPHVDVVRVISRSARPCDAIGPFVDDRRSLGVLIGRIVVFDADRTHDIDAHLTNDLPGWDVRETSAYRWTQGDAVLPLGPRDPNNHAVLIMHVEAAGPYLADKNLIKKRVLRLIA
ncbi:Hint domain-containing protein [Acetobacter senegalensis]|uniref:Hint domain-containing protein n=1 Tax=Acetobacter senegalensis TaxID=446692 RepID=UPI00264F9243|nr:Hint domain-containing protein [Acetobacter senegalensis]MDN7355734.1 Hint domain-containing protein [Acetobacter senegalensis]